MAESTGNPKKEESQEDPSIVRLLIEQNGETLGLIGAMVENQKDTIDLLTSMVEKSNDKMEDDRNFRQEMIETIRETGLLDLLVRKLRVVPTGSDGASEPQTG